MCGTTSCAGVTSLIEFRGLSSWLAMNDLFFLTMVTVGNLPVFISLGWFVIGDWDEFRECIDLWLPPDLSALFSGRREIIVAQGKLLLFLVLCVIVVGLEWLLTRWW